MKPDILPGDLVEVEPVTAMSFRPAMVIAMVQSNQVPNAHIRGMSNVYPWSYYVMTSDPIKFVGPLMRSQINRVRRS